MVARVGCRATCVMSCRRITEPATAIDHGMDIPDVGLKAGAAMPALGF